MSANVKYTGHGVNTGGLQQHSVGDTYPFMVVGTQHHWANHMKLVSKRTRYYVLDASTGERYYWAPSGAPQTWADIGSAEMVAGHLKSGYQSALVVILRETK